MEYNQNEQQPDERRPDAGPEPMPADQQHHRQDGPIAGREDTADEDTMRDEDVLGEEVVEDELAAESEERNPGGLPREEQSGLV